MHTHSWHGRRHALAVTTLILTPASPPAERIEQDRIAEPMDSAVSSLRWRWLRCNAAALPAILHCMQCTAQSPCTFRSKSCTKINCSGGLPPAAVSPQAPSSFAHAALLDRGFCSILRGRLLPTCGRMEMTWVLGRVTGTNPSRVRPARKSCSRRLLTTCQKEYRQQLWYVLKSHKEVF